MSNAINVAKFGGTSVANFGAISHCANVVKRNPETRVVVVSAAAGVTNFLVQLAFSPLSQAQIAEVCEQIKSIEYAILEQLDNKASVQPKLDDLLTEIEQLAHHEEILHRHDLKDALMSMGERMSSLLCSEVFKQNGIEALNFDVRKVLITDDTYGEAVPNVELIKVRSDEVLAPDIKRHVIVTQGFVGADESGNTTTLGRGGSDFTAALLAEALNAKSCEIWTDVIGVYTTDPRLTPAARPLPELSFEEAAEMATFGAKVLHPATMEPALRRDIPVFVGSSREPEKGGTWIVRDCEHEPPYRAITRRREQVMVTVKTPKMLYAQGYLEKVFSIIAKHKLSVDLVTTSEIAISFTLDNPPNSVAERLNQRTIEELETMSEVTVEQGFDLVTVVGNHMQSQKGVPSRIFAAIADYNLRMICFGANPHNMSFLVKAEDSAEIVSVLHNALFE
ncbi:lysine-sensitive aspartokinase 3 [Alteromonas facilis]|uniref:lysine-sensitive aspartokinase 3 n=1 Tax=Alteromonas facilis TaxID=2048004 RepID=UPI00196B6634|nr:lysine-sensitive aspartokinase 3 [Alteromonas facilis]